MYDKDRKAMVIHHGRGGRKVNRRLIYANNRQPHQDEVDSHGIETNREIGAWVHHRPGSRVRGGQDQDGSQSAHDGSVSSESLTAQYHRGPPLPGACPPVVANHAAIPDPHAGAGSDGAQGVPIGIRQWKPGPVPLADIEKMANAASREAGAAASNSPQQPPTPDAPPVSSTRYGPPDMTETRHTHQAPAPDPREMLNTGHHHASMAGSQHSQRPPIDALPPISTAGQRNASVASRHCSRRIPAEDPKTILGSGIRDGSTAGSRRSLPPPAQADEQTFNAYSCSTAGSQGFQFAPVENPPGLFDAGLGGPSMAGSQHPKQRPAEAIPQASSVDHRSEAGSHRSQYIPVEDPATVLATAYRDTSATLSQRTQHQTAEAFPPAAVELPRIEVTPPTQQFDSGIVEGDSEDGEAELGKGAGGGDDEDEDEENDQAELHEYELDLGRSFQNPIPEDLKDEGYETGHGSTHSRISSAAPSRKGLRPSSAAPSRNGSR